MRFKGSRNVVSGLALAAVFALTGVAAAAAQQTQSAPGQDGAGPRAVRPWGHKDGGPGRRGGGGRGGFGPFGGRLAERLNLTDAQREQLRQIGERYRQTFSAQRERGGGRGRGFDPLAGGAFDEAAVRAAAQARANAQVEREVARARMTHEMYNVLTAEQKAQLAAERQQMEQRRQEFRTRRGPRRGQPQIQ
ncbi:MAG TPA: Spy/CpxP family protein refolding chaperone [Pyrinomonadaceae bacterium]|jgi:Spy/CpxP family protein refolding chaperone